MKSKKSFMLMLFLFSFLLITTPSMASVVNFDFAQNSAPNPESDFVIIEPSSPTTDDDVICRASDGDYYFFAWLVNGIAAESNSVSATSLTLDSSETSENDVLTCIIYLDSDHSIELGRESVSVASEQIQEYPSKEVEITPSEAYTDDDLVCDVVTDDDLYYYVWQVNGITKLTEQSPKKTSTLQSSYTEKHDSVKCLAYYDESHTYEVGEDIVEILNSNPVALFKVNTTSALVYEDILFDASASYDPDNDELTYEWDFGDGSSSTEKQAVHSYSYPGEYEVELTVSDGESSDSDSDVITISGNLVIEGAKCFDPVMLGASQVCSVNVTDNSGRAIGGSTVEIFDSSNNLLAICTTDSISGGCSANFTASELGENEIKIVASKEGYGSSKPEFLTFNVLKQRYELHDFEVFNDTAYSEEDDTFYRGESLYARFRVYDLIDEEYVSEDIVTSASLVSDAGGNIDLVRDEDADLSDPAYFHFKTTIPLTHFFFGDSAVFAFAINFSDDSMGQADKEIEILNNPPEIKDLPDITFTKITQNETIDLTEYATDLEDPNELAWNISSYDSNLLDVELDNTIITIKPKAYTKATTYIDLSVYDLDNDSASSTIKVIINIEEPNTPPVITVEGSLNKTIAEGENLNFVVNFFDEDSDPLDISIEGKPYNADFQPLNLLMPNASDITYLFSWTPDYNQSGNYEIKLIANDGKDTTEAIINIEVENTNRAPVAVLEANTTSALVYEDILFDASASYDIDGDELTYEWDFGDGSTSTEKQAVHSYSEPGEYEVILHVSDGESSDSESKVITISGYLDIQDAECFDPVMLGSKQVCSVAVTDNSGKAMGGSTVEIFDSSNTLLASCTTDSLSGGCSASFTASELGENEIKIVASKEGYGSSKPEFLTFNVLEKRYELHDFSVFNDSAYSKEDDIFYRGESIYTRFKVFDLITETNVSNDNISSGIVTSASLISYDAGGNIDLVRDEDADSPDSDYFHFTTKIPLTHFFFGDSAVFAFAINFSDESMGQANKNVEILNNPPEIIKDFPDITFTKITQTETIDLTDYATDLEDKELTWNISSYDSTLLDLELEGSVLTIKPAAYTKATAYVNLTVHDLDKDSASSTIKVILNIEEQECTPGETRRCGPSTNKGICEYGVQTCTADGYWGECIGAVYPREEIENDLDDDCDGEIDEGFYDFNEAVQFTRVEVFPLTGNEIEPSSIIAVKPHLSSKSSSTFKDVRAVAYLLGTDSRSLKTNFEIRKDRDNSVMLYLEIPPYVQKGDYLIKITISNDNIHMTKFVPIIIS